MLTRFLNLGGASLPDDLTPSVAGNNEKGFWEAREALSINIKILNELCVDWWSACPIYENWYLDKDLHSFRLQIRSFLSREFAQNTTLLLKDPRLCRLFPIWNIEFAKLGIKSAAVLSVRDPRAVAASLYDRDGIPFKHSYFLWLRYMLEAEKSTRDIKRHFISYDNLLSNWETEAESVNKNLWPVWVGDWKQASREVDEFIDPRLNHFRHSTEGDPPLPALVEKAFEIFTLLAANDSASEVLVAELEQVEKSLGGIDSLVGRSLEYDSRRIFEQRLERKEVQKHSDFIEHQKAEQKSLISELREENSKSVTELRDKLDAVGSGLSRMRDQAEQFQSIFKLKEKQLSELGLHIKELSNKNTQLSEQHRVFDEKLKIAKNLNKDLSEKLESSREKSHGLEQEKTEAFAQISALNEKLESSREKSHGLEQEKTEAFAQISAERIKCESQVKITNKLEESLRLRNRQLTEANSEAKSKTSLAASYLETLIFHSSTNEAPRHFNIWAIPVSQSWSRKLKDKRIFGFLSHIGDDNDDWKQIRQDGAISVAKLIIKRGLFDGDFYRKQIKQKSISDLYLALHYLKTGWREGYSPSLLFDSEFYCARVFNTGANESPICPLIHYLYIGSKKEISPHPLFDPKWYKSQLPRDIATSIDALGHYLQWGWKHNLDPHWAFNVHWYLRKNQDVRTAGVEPLVHYLCHGELEGRTPHPFFEPEYYRNQACITAGSQSALRHFVEEGIHKLTSPHILIDPVHVKSVLSKNFETWFHAVLDFSDCQPNYLFSYQQYRLLNSDVAAENVHPLVHYLEFGYKESRRTHVLFDPNYYSRLVGLEANKDPLRHFFLTPPSMRKAPHQSFDELWYSEKYKDLKQLSCSAFEHYMTRGAQEGRDPSKDFNAKYYCSQIDLGSTKNPLEHYHLLGRRLGLATSESKTEAVDKPVAGWKRIAGLVNSSPGRPAVLMVAHVSSGRLFGSERSFLDMVEGVNASDLVNIKVVLPQENDHYINQLKPYVTDIYVRQIPWWRKNVSVSESTLEAFKMLLEANDDIEVVHVNTIMLREPLIAAKARKILSVVHIREIIDHDKKLTEYIGLPWQEIVSIVKSTSDFLICNSEATRTLYDSEGENFVIPNTINVEEFGEAVSKAERDRESLDEFRVGLISSNIEKKGVKDFLEVAKKCQNQKDLKFVLIGPVTSFVESLLEAKNYTNVEILGYLNEAHEAIANLDVIVNLSHFAESFGRTILEAMAASKPVVAYDYGALPYLVSHGKTGFLVPHRDIDSTAKYIKKLHSDSSLCMEMGGQGKAKALEEYDISSYKKKMHHAYEFILKNPGKESSTFFDSGSKARTNRLLEHEISFKRIHKANISKPLGKNQLRIAYFQWHFPVPSETFVLNELRALVAEGYDVRVFCKQIPHPDFKPDFPITWERVDTPEDLAKELRRHRCTVVHSHFTYPTVTEMVWPACELSGVQFTFCAHAQDIFKYENDRKNRIDEVVLSTYCSGVFVPGRFHQKYLTERGVPREKIIINPQGVDSNLYPELSDKHVTRRNRKICAIHRFTEKKGLEYVIRAAAQIKSLGVDINLYGYGELAEEYQDLIRELAVDNVFIHQDVLSRDQIISIFDQHDLFLSPCVRAKSGDMDGIPTILMEAMLSGLPVLTTNISSIPELVQDEITGLVCNAKDENSLAQTIERFYSYSDVKVSGIVERAAAHVRGRFEVNRLLRMSKRVWTQNRLDIVIVSWNGLEELREVISRIYLHTHFPFHLIICDNDSNSQVVDFLTKLQQEKENLTLIEKGCNSMVGPGTNTAASEGESEFVVYICGREGFVTQPFWDSAIVNYMTENPKVGLAGTACYSPSYLFGRDYPVNIPEWNNFRNQNFALENLDRKFCHVQGGLFVMRREMLEDIGGFNDAVPHNYTDVEFSYYVESCGWKLGELPHILSLYNKTRPSICSRFDESIYAIHPPKLEDLSWIEKVIEAESCLCNVCGATDPNNLNRQTRCSNCQADSRDKSLYRLLAESLFTYRRLPALGVDIGKSLEGFWKTNFQGSYLSHSEVSKILVKKGRFEFNDGRLSLIVTRSLNLLRADLQAKFLLECKRLLDPTEGELWIQVQYGLRESESGSVTFASLVDGIKGAGFVVSKKIRFNSHSVNYDQFEIVRCCIANYGGHE